jgi:uncharacterized protein
MPVAPARTKSRRDLNPTALCYLPPLLVLSRAPLVPSTKKNRGDREKPVGEGRAPCYRERRTLSTFFGWGAFHTWARLFRSGVSCHGIQVLPGGLAARWVLRSFIPLEFPIMRVDILKQARYFLIAFLRSKHNPLVTKHPWRNEWEFAVLHSLRVEAYVQRILEREQHNLDHDDIVLLRLAAILHDIGRFEETDNHAETGAAIVNKWLQTQPALKNEISCVETLLGLIASHSEKEQPEEDYGKAVLKDADILDEIGILSVFMAANWVNHQSPFFFHQLRDRLVEFEIPFCERALAKLNTLGGKAMLNKKRAFIQMLITQLDDELSCDIEALGYLSEQSQ